MRKYLFVCASVAAFAAIAVLPAMASASPVLKNDAATPANVAVGSAIKAVSTNSVFIASTTKIECATVTLNGELKENTGTKIKGEITSGSAVGQETPPANSCKGEAGGAAIHAKVTLEELPWCIETIGAAMEWELTGNACGVTPRGKVAFLDKNFNTSGAEILHCTYEATSVKGTYNTTTTPATLTVGTGAGANFTRNNAGSSIACPTPGTLTGSFKLTSSSGTETMIE